LFHSTEQSSVSTTDHTGPKLTGGRSPAQRLARTERDLEKNKARLDQLFEEESEATSPQVKEGLVKHQEAIIKLIDTIEQRRKREAAVVRQLQEQERQESDRLHLVKQQNERRAKELEQWALNKWICHDRDCLAAARRGEPDPAPPDVPRPSCVKADGRNGIATRRYLNLAEATRTSLKYRLGLKNQRAGNIDAVDEEWMKRKERYLRWGGLNEESMTRVYDKAADCLNQVRAANRAAAAEAGPSTSSDVLSSTADFEEVEKSFIEFLEDSDASVH